jgi:alkanesulfonate monooxygenase SsuD/methylene tetrahydromethanopterin reductase-like flavin-dependent oxidoreductase (luciferase family)
VFDHFHTVPEPTDEMTLESFTTLAALARETQRVRLGHMVICTGFRNPALTAKMASTLDVLSGGRFELGIGAGWKEEEWRAYGYGFPTLGERMAALGDHLEVIRAMLGPGRATYEGRFATVRGAINIPKGIQDHIP